MPKKPDTSKKSGQAKKSPDVKKQLTEVAWKAIDMFRNERGRFIAGLVTLVLMIYLCLMLVSFLFTGAADQSIVGGLTFKQLKDAAPTGNWAGTFGAWLSNIIMVRWFGISSLLLAAFGLLTALRLMRIRTVPLGRYFVGSLFLFIWISVFFGFVCHGNSQLLFLGGGHGYLVSQWLVQQTGVAGIVLILLVTMLIFLVFAVQGTMQAIRRWMQWSRPKDRAAAVATGQPGCSESTADSPAASDADAYGFAAEDTTPAGEDDFGPESSEEEAPEETGNAYVPEQQPDVISIKAAPRSVIDTDIDMTVTVAKGDADQPVADDTPQKPRSLAEDLLARLGEYDPKADLSHFRNPPSNLLKDYGSDELTVNEQEQQENKNRILEVLDSFGIAISSIQATIGPTVTLYEIVPGTGVRISKIKNLEDDIALSLSALGIRIIAPIPGKGTIGIEVPSRNPKIVSMRGLIQSRKFQESKYDLPIALGKTIMNDVFVFDLCKTPHLLVAGATGQGKSVGLNAIITSLLYKKHPGELKIVLVDPKMVEFSIYKDIENYYLAKLPGDEHEPIITDSDKVIQTLQSLTVEMDDRYRLLSMARCRNVKEYNEKFRKRELNPEKGHKFMPYIVIIIDEFGDLIMTAGREIETPIARIAQKARAVGMHMVIATQRPTTNIITGTIKANFPARLAFKVTSQIDSRTILDATGANQLIGKGDCLFQQGGDLTRIQCAFVDTPEVESVVDFIAGQQGYSHAFELPEYVPADGGGSGAQEADLGDKDSLFEEAARLVVDQQQGSTSYIQRRFSIGYNRAGRIMDQLEKAGIVGHAEGSKPRQVLVDSLMGLEQILESRRN